MNHATVAGHLGSDPEVRFTSGGQKVTTLRVASRARKDETIWWKVTVWGDQFDKMMTYLKKGSAIIVVGEVMKPEVYTDREGKTQVSMGLVAFHLTFSPFGKGKSGEEAGNKQQSGLSNSNDSSGFAAPAFENSFSSGSSHQDDEIPF